MFWKKKTKTPQAKVEKSPDGTESYFVKLVLMGDGAVGKTSLRRNYLGLGFTTEHMMTIGADFAATDKEFEFEMEGGGTKKFKVTFQIWDLAGQSTFTNVRSMYYKGCLGALLVFDRTRPTSFQNIDSWIAEMHKHNKRGKIPLVILGNKADLVEQAKEVVPQSDVDAYLKEVNQKFSTDRFKIEYYDTSALTGKNVEKAFETLTHNIMKNLKAI